MEKNVHIVLFKGRLKTLDFFVDQFIEYLNKHKIDYYLVDTNRAETCKKYDSWGIRGEQIFR